MRSIQRKTHALPSGRTQFICSLLLLCLTFSSLACGTLGLGQSRPDWITSRPSDGNYYYGLGRGVPPSVWGESPEDTLAKAVVDGFYDIYAQSRGACPYDLVFAEFDNEDKSMASVDLMIEDHRVRTVSGIMIYKRATVEDIVNSMESKPRPCIYVLLRYPKASANW